MPSAGWPATALHRASFPSPACAGLWQARHLKQLCAALCTTRTPGSLPAWGSARRQSLSPSPRGSAPPKSRLQSPSLSCSSQKLSQAHGSWERKKQCQHLPQPPALPGSPALLVTQQNLPCSSMDGTFAGAQLHSPTTNCPGHLDFSPSPKSVCN